MMTKQDKVSYHYTKCFVTAVDRVLSEGSLSMEIIVNPKTLDNNIPVIQLETAVGAAMKCFEKGLGKEIYLILLTCLSL